MPDYLSRILNYSNLLKEIEIAGEEHLKVISEDPYSYLKKAEELKKKISSDEYLLPEDKEKMLKEIDGYTQKLKSREKDELQPILLGFLLFYLIQEGTLFPALVENLMKILSE